MKKDTHGHCMNISKIMISYDAVFVFATNYDQEKLYPDTPELLNDGVLSILIYCCRLTHWGRDEIAANSQTIFSWIKMYEFRLNFAILTQIKGRNRGPLWCMFRGLEPGRRVSTRNVFPWQPTGGQMILRDTSIIVMDKRNRQLVLFLTGMLH